MKKSGIISSTHLQRIVFKNGIIDRLVKDFRLVFRGVVVYVSCAMGARTVCSGGLAGFRVVDGGGRGPIGSEECQMAAAILRSSKR